MRSSRANRKPRVYMLRVFEVGEWTVKSEEPTPHQD